MQSIKRPIDHIVNLGVHPFPRVPHLLDRISRQISSGQLKTNHRNETPDKEG
jgi:hypothetical protein